MTVNCHPHLQASAVIGNLYTASMYMGLRSLLEFEFAKGVVNLFNKRIGFGSYGSGCSAMVFSGVIQENYKELVKRMDLEKDIGQRTKISIDDYKRLHDNERKFDDFLTNAHREFVLIKIGGITADKAGFREYNYVS